MIDAAEIERRIAEALPDAKVSVSDMTGTRDHYDVTVVSDAFEGVLPVQRHRMVYAPLKDVMGDGALHALKLTTKTTTEIG
ncbi:MAG: BolA/IbaG family iron-sulfur metabolism protein [Myxococcota bacterium]